MLKVQELLCTLKNLILNSVRRFQKQLSLFCFKFMFLDLGEPMRLCVSHKTCFFNGEGLPVGLYFGILRHTLKRIGVKNFNFQLFANHGIIGNRSVHFSPFNPIAYGILRLSQLRGWDFSPTPQITMLKIFD